MREIAAEGLEEEDEDDPLVPVLRHSLRPRHPWASSLPPSPGQAVTTVSAVNYEGPVDPTVRIHQVLRKTLHWRTDYGVPQVLFECLYEAEHTEDGERELVVQLEC